MYLNNYSEICTEPSPPFAPYPGQVLTLRYHVEKGSTVGFIKSREGFTNVHTEVVVVEVAYGSNENEYGYAFSFAKQDMGRPALYPHSKIGMLQFPFIKSEIAMVNPSAYSVRKWRVGDLLHFGVLFISTALILQDI